jgi:hypothetical protein
MSSPMEVPPMLARSYNLQEQEPQTEFASLVRGWARERALESQTVTLMECKIEIENVAVLPVPDWA